MRIPPRGSLGSLAGARWPDLARYNRVDRRPGGGPDHLAATERRMRRLLRDFQFAPMNDVLGVG